MSNDPNRIVKVTIGFNINTEEIEFIQSDFEREDHNYKDPIGYTAKLIQMGLEHWIKEKIGILCPNCDAQQELEWDYCPVCGWGGSKDE